MLLSEFRDDLVDEVTAMTDGTIKHTITKTWFVPSIDDPAITYPNLTTGEQKSKLLETAVLFVDLRDSTQISLRHSQEKLSGLYSAYVRAMTRAGSFFGGKVRNIIGDRVMVVFDHAGCHANAFNTAVLMNSVAKYVLDRHVTTDTIRCGIGIDYGEMLISKTGIIKYGSENTSNKSLVWLGKPANIASKLTDMANKLRVVGGDQVTEGFTDSGYSPSYFKDVPVDDFLSHLSFNYLEPRLNHSDPRFRWFLKQSGIPTVDPPILITQEFYDGLVANAPTEQAVVNGWLGEVDVQVAGHSQAILGGDIIYTTFQ